MFVQMIIVYQRKIYLILKEKEMKDDKGYCELTLEIVKNQEVIVKPIHKQNFNSKEENKHMTFVQYLKKGKVIQ